MRRFLLGPALKPTIFLLAMAPFAWCAWQVWLLYNGQPGALGADPGKAIVLFNGEWALHLLIATLAVSPLRQWFKLPELARVRRMLGLFTFFYAAVHLAAYGTFLLGWELGAIGEDIVKRPYITVGFAAFLMLLPMAITSTNGMIKRLKKRWKQLHSLIYAVALLAAVHVIWIVRSDYTEAVIYTAALGVLVAARFIPQRIQLFRTTLSARQAG